MNDFNGSVAQQDVSISTDVVRTATVGGNFYENVLYVTDRFSSFGADTPVYPVVKKSNYSDVLDDYAYFSDAEKKIVKGNLASLFAYGTDVKVYIIPSTELANYKLYGYFTYLDLEWNTTDGTTTDYALADTANTTLTNVKAILDKDFTSLLVDMAVDPVNVKGTSTTTTAGTLGLVTAFAMDATVFARPAIPTGTEASVNAFVDGNGDPIGYSPAFYQLGKTLSSTNESGVPVGNSFDMTAVNFQNVLPTADTNTEVISGVSATFADYFEGVNVNYFKPVGNGTMQITNFGGWTILKNCTTAEWIVAYLNFMNRVACATVITSGKALKNARTYNELLDAVKANIAGQVRNERITEFKMTAPAFSDLPKTNGHTISIPNAWSGVYVDNVRKVKISGTLTVAA
jgi:hypothetical protein